MFGYRVKQYMSERLTFVLGDKLPIAEAAISIHRISQKKGKSCESWGEGRLKNQARFDFPFSFVDNSDQFHF